MSLEGGRHLVALEEMCSSLGSLTALTKCVLQRESCPKTFRGVSWMLGSAERSGSRAACICFAASSSVSVCVSIAGRHQAWLRRQTASSCWKCCDAFVHFWAPDEQRRWLVLFDSCVVFMKVFRTLVCLQLISGHSCCRSPWRQETSFFSQCKLLRLISLLWLFSLNYCYFVDTNMTYLLLGNILEIISIIYINSFYVLWTRWVSLVVVEQTQLMLRLQQSWKRVVVLIKTWRNFWINEWRSQNNLVLIVNQNTCLWVQCTEIQLYLFVVWKYGSLWSKCLILNFKLEPDLSWKM